METMTGTEAILQAIKMGLIRVDNDGTIWSLATQTSKGLCPRVKPLRMEIPNKKTGYLMVHVWIRGKQYMASAHRVVWMSLRGAIQVGLDINHIDGNKHNNHPENLDLVTRSENLRHAFKTGLRKTTDFAADYSENVKVLRIEGKSYSQIAAILGIGVTTAWRAAKK